MIINAINKIFFILKKTDHECVSHCEILYICYSSSRIRFFKKEKIEDNKTN